MRSFSQELKARTRALKRRRLTLDELTRAFYAANPETESRPDRRQQILAALNAEAAAGILSLPANKGPHWDVLGKPALPQFVTLALDSRKSDELPIDWLPELAFAASLPRTKKRQQLAVLNQYLIEHPIDPTAEPLPYRERAFRIFGHEKALDPYVEGDLLYGQLPLSVLGAYYAKAGNRLVFAVESEAAGKPGLVVENEHSYVSVRNWNTSRPSPRYAFVVFGSGKEVLHNERVLIDLAKEHHTAAIHYLGDLDPTGIWIPTELAARIKRIDAEIELTPELPAYAWLLEHANRSQLSANRHQNQATTWLGPLSRAADTLFANREWIPQEALTREDLSAVFEQ